MTRSIQIVLTVFLLSLPLSFVSGQITAETIALACQSDSGRSKDNYMEYGEELAKTLSQYSAAALERIFGAPKTVQLSAGDSLNDFLGMDNIEFPLLSSALPASAADALGSLAQFLVENPGTTIKIEGHVSQNFFGAQSLSEDRAEAAKNFLTSLGIDSSRIETEGLGYSAPIDGGSGSEQRRIEFLLVDPPE